MARAKGLQVDGAFIRRRRERLHKTQEQLANNSGLGVRHIQRLERAGSEQRVSPVTLDLLARALQTAPYELLGEPTAAVRAKLAQAGFWPAAPPEPWLPRPEAAPLIEALGAPPLNAPAPPVLALISGPRGSGKTAMARFIARAVADKFPHGVVWVSARHRARPVDAVETQQAIAEALGLAGRLPSPAAVGPAQLAAAFQSVFWDRDRLLVLDDVIDFELIGAFVGPDAVHGRGAVLVTTHLASVAEAARAPHRVHLDHLDREESRRFIGHYIDAARVDADPAGFARLLRLIGGSPRALAITGRLLARERLLTPGDLADELEHNPAVAAAEATAHGGPGGDYGAASLMSAFLAAREFVHPKAWEALGALSCLDDLPFDLDLARVVLDVASPRAARRALSPLVNVFLVGVQPDGRFVLEPHVAAFARLGAREESDRAFDRLAAHLARGAEAMAAARDWGALDAELPLVGHVLDVTLAASALPGDPAGSSAAAFRGPSPGDALDATSSVFAKTVTALAPGLADRFVPRAGRWLLAALHLHHRAGRRAALAATALAFGRWWLRTQAALARAAEWFALAEDVAADCGATATATLAALELGRAKMALTEVEPSRAAFERVVRRASRGEGRPLERAVWLAAAAVTATRQPPPGPGWVAAERQLDQALALLEGAGEGDGLIAQAYRADLALIRRVLGAPDGAPVPIPTEALRAEAPLLASRLDLLRAELCADPAERDALRAAAVRTWIALIERPPAALHDALWLLAELAYYLGLRRRPPGEPPRDAIVAGGYAISDVTREIRPTDPALAPVGILFPVEPLATVFAKGRWRTCWLLAQRTLGPESRAAAVFEALADPSAGPGPRR